MLYVLALSDPSLVRALDIAAYHAFCSYTYDILSLLCVTFTLFIFTN